MQIIEKARRQARKAVESLYEGLCTVVEFGKTKDPVTKTTGVGEIVVMEGQPCRLSFSSFPAVSQTDTVTNVTQSIKLLLAPEIVIKPGSKITVTQCGVTTDYQCSGQPAIYPTHQEINLELYRGRA